jgi:hypothetical protein
MADTPGALQLRLLETIVEVAAEKNSTLVLPFPVELLRFLENNNSLSSALSATQSAAGKLSEVSERERPGVPDMLLSAPDVAALEAREPEADEHPTVGVLNGIGAVANGRSSGKDAG